MSGLGELLQFYNEKKRRESADVRTFLQMVENEKTRKNNLLMTQYRQAAQNYRSMLSDVHNLESNLISKGITVDKMSKLSGIDVTGNAQDILNTFSEKKKDDLQLTLNDMNATEDSILKLRNAYSSLNDRFNRLAKIGDYYVTGLEETTNLATSIYEAADFDKNAIVGIDEFNKYIETNKNAKQKFDKLFGKYGEDFVRSNVFKGLQDIAKAQKDMENTDYKNRTMKAALEGSKNQTGAGVNMTKELNNNIAQMITPVNSAIGRFNNTAKDFGRSLLPLSTPRVGADPQVTINNVRDNAIRVLQEADYTSSGDDDILSSRFDIINDPSASDQEKRDAATEILRNINRDHNVVNRIDFKGTQDKEKAATNVLLALSDFEGVANPKPQEPQTTETGSVDIVGAIMDRYGVPVEGSSVSQEQVNKSQSGVSPVVESQYLTDTYTFGKQPQKEISNDQTQGINKTQAINAIISDRGTRQINDVNLSESAMRNSEGIKIHPVVKKVQRSEERITKVAEKKIEKAKSPETQTKIGFNANKKRYRNYKILQKKINELEKNIRIREGVLKEKKSDRINFGDEYYQGVQAKVDNDKAALVQLKKTSEQWYGDFNDPELNTVFERSYNSVKSDLRSYNAKIKRLENFLRRNPADKSLMQRLTELRNKREKLIKAARLKNA